MIIKLPVQFLKLTENKGVSKSGSEYNFATIRVVGGDSVLDLSVGDTVDRSELRSIKSLDDIEVSCELSSFSDKYGKQIPRLTVVAFTV